MLLSFTKESLGKMAAGRKVTTIRRNPSRWRKWMEGDRPKRLQIYRGNPRNGGERICELGLWFVQEKFGFQLTQKDAIYDGFEDYPVPSLIARLAELHGMTKTEVEMERWAIIGMQIPTELSLITWHKRDQIEEENR